MFCPKCGKQTGDGGKFCTMCGYKVDGGGEPNRSDAAYPFRTRKMAVGALAAIAVLVVVMTVFASGIFGGDEKKIESTVENFNADLKKCLDLSVLLDGNEVDLSPLEKYFAEGQVSKTIRSTQETISYVSHRYGISSGKDNFLGEMGIDDSSISQKVLEKDSLFDKRLWKNVLTVRLTPTDIELAKDKKTADVEMEIHIKLDTDVFKDSKLAEYLDEVSSYEDTEVHTLTMEKGKDGMWRFLGY